MNRLKDIMQERQERKTQQKQEELSYSGDIGNDQAMLFNNCSREYQAYVDAYGAASPSTPTQLDKYLECEIREMKKMRHHYTGTLRKEIESRIEANLEQIRTRNF